jgi:hypothetical protein
MVLNWLAGAPSRPKRERRTRQTPHVCLELERLEDRWVPAAIRNLSGFTANTLAANDDFSTDAVNVGFSLNFFGTVANQVYVNNNGNITFTGPLSQFTPGDLTGSDGGLPIIAPFFADVDTTGAGSGLVTYGTDTLCGRAAFGVDWVNVGYFASHVDKLNSFQLILVDRSDTGAGNFDIEFNYNSIQWETGDASGGTNGLGGISAGVGYSNGTGNPGTSFQLTGSEVNGAFLDGGPNSLAATSLEASTPGRYHFLVRNGQVIQNVPLTGDVTGNSRVFYPFRYVSDPLTGVQTGNITVLNVSPSSATGINSCEDIVSTSGSGVNVDFTGPISVVFSGVPSNVTIENPTGYTASGKPYVTLDVTSLPQDTPLRFAVVQTNTTLSAPTTFEIGYDVTVVAGQNFDPTAY